MSFTLGESQEFLTKVFGSGKLTGNGLNFAISCPFCQNTNNKKKLEIRLDYFVCHCWICGFKSKNLVKLLKETNNQHHVREYLDKFGKSLLLKEQAEEELFSDKLNRLLDKTTSNNKQPETQQIDLPKDFKLLAVNLDSKTAKPYLDYLIKQRGLELRDLWYYKVGIAPGTYPNRVIIPSHRPDGSLNYFITRTINSWEKPKYYSPVKQRTDLIFNEINIDWTLNRIVLVEGVFDLMKVAYENTVPLLGSELDEKTRLFQTIINNADTMEVILGLDNDAKTKTVKLVKQFQNYGINPKIAIPNNNDFGQMMNKQNVEQQINNAREFTFQQLLQWNI